MCLLCQTYAGLTNPVQACIMGGMTLASSTDPWHPEMVLGDRLRLLRRDYGLIVGRRLSQKDFADQLRIPSPTYAAWEAGNARPPDPVLARIAAATGVDLIWLQSGQTSDPFKPNGSPRQRKRTPGWFTAAESIPPDIPSATPDWPSPISGRMIPTATAA